MNTISVHFKNFLRKIGVLTEHRDFSVVFTTYDNKYYIRQKKSGENKNFWMVVESGNIYEKKYFPTLEDCRQYIAMSLVDDRGRKYKLETMKELKRISFSRVIVDYQVKIKKLNDSKNTTTDALIENISHGGCKLKIDKLQSIFPVDEVILIQFNLNDFDIHKDGILEIEAMVRWTANYGKEVGCKFMERDEGKDIIFNKILKTLIK